MFCPVQGCRAASSHTHAGWQTMAGMRPHLDSHLLGQLPGRPSAEWMRAGNWTGCGECGKLVSLRCANGVHRRCLAQRLRAAPDLTTATGLPGSHAAVDDGGDELPNVEDIFALPCATRDFVGEGLLPMAEKEFLSAVAQAVFYNRPDAWDHELPGGTDTPERRVSRKAWQEMLMFSKACLPILPGGRAKEQRNKNIIATKLERWAAGERASLWKELPLPKPKRRAKPKLDEDAAAARREEEATSFVMRGLPAKAMSRLTSPGLAPDTPEIEGIMRRKFVDPPLSQQMSTRPQAPAANEISPEGVAKGVASFAKGAGCGPSGLRSDFVKQVIGEEGDKPGIGVITSMCTLLANGLAPKKLAPFIGGATGTALDKTSKTGEQDARPVCSGEFWRRLVGKVLLGTEMENLREYLYPHQLAVGVAGGVEVMPHISRQWLADHAEDVDRVLLAYDEGNAHNEVDRHTLLQRMWEIAPGICRWLEYIYPTNRATVVFYRGRQIDSKAGGQQGCPLIMACHGVVQRILVEALGVVQVDPRTSQVAPVLDPPAALDMTPMFADDGIVAGRSGEVLRALKHLQTVMPPLGLRFSMLELVPAAGADHAVDVAPFEACGCTVTATGRIEVLKSPVGPQEWCQEYAKSRTLKYVGALAAVGEFKSRHAGLYLMKWACNGGEVNYMSRTTPLDCCREALEQYDVASRAAFEKLAGTPLSDSQWAQAASPSKAAGVGLRVTTECADSAYVASWLKCRPICQDIYPREGLTLPEVSHPVVAWARINECLPEAAKLGAFSADAEVTQKALNTRLVAAKFKGMLAHAAPDDQERLIAAAAPPRAKWQEGAPSKTLDTHLSNSDFTITVALQLGVDVCSEPSSCPFCASICDCKGRHHLSCTAGGDNILEHNEVRDEVFRWCRRGSLQPTLEKKAFCIEWSCQATGGGLRTCWCVARRVSCGACRGETR